MKKGEFLDQKFSSRNAVNKSYKVAQISGGSETAATASVHSHSTIADISHLNNCPCYFIKWLYYIISGLPIVYLNLAKVRMSVTFFAILLRLIEKNGDLEVKIV